MRTPPSQWTQELLPLWTGDAVEAFAKSHSIRPRYNIAPTQSISCIGGGDATDGPRSWFVARWGLIPFWAKDLAIGNRMINARSETVHEKRSFRQAFRRRRCLIPADGYFEWKKTDDGKQPYLIQRHDGGVLALAGLWEENQKLGQDDQPLVTCTILTTSANTTTRAIHDRMPVLLRGDDQVTWLACDEADTDSIRDLLRPAPDDWLTAVAVSERVGNPRNDSPDVIEPVGSGDPDSLFD